MPRRTFTAPHTAPYRDARVKRLDFALAEAISWFLADKPEEGSGAQPTTLAAYRSWLRGFCDWLPEDRQVLASLEPEAVEGYVRTTAANVNTPDEQDDRAQVLRPVPRPAQDLVRRQRRRAAERARDCVMPRPSGKGMPGYRADELRTIERTAIDGYTPLRSRAVIAVLRHGFRAKEARPMQLRDVVLPPAKGCAATSSSRARRAPRRAPAGCASSRCPRPPATPSSSTCAASAQLPRRLCGPY